MNGSCYFASSPKQRAIPKVPEPFVPSGMPFGIGVWVIRIVLIETMFTCVWKSTWQLQMDGSGGLQDLRRVSTERELKPTDFAGTFQIFPLQHGHKISLGMFRTLSRARTASLLPFVHSNKQFYMHNKLRAFSLFALSSSLTFSNTFASPQTCYPDRSFTTDMTQENTNGFMTLWNGSDEDKFASWTILVTPFNPIHRLS